MISRNDARRLARAVQRMLIPIGRAGFLEHGHGQNQWLFVKMYKMDAHCSTMESGTFLAEARGGWRLRRIPGLAESNGLRPLTSPMAAEPVEAKFSAC